MIVLNKKYLSTFIIFLLILIIPCISAAETVQYTQPGQNMSPNRVLLSDFTITSERPEICTGDTLELSCVLTSEAFYPMLISLPDGLYFTALDPDGEEVKVGGAYIGEILSPDESVRVKSRIRVDKTGLWKIWPSYNIQNSNGIVQYNPKEWQAAEIFIDKKYVPHPDLVIVEAGTAGENGGEKRFYYIVENTGPLGANATISGIFVNDEDTEIKNPVGMLPSGESQKVFFTLQDVSKGDKITIVLDAAGAEGELDEENNDWSFVVNMKNDVSKTSSTEPESESGGREKEESESGSVVYYPATTAVCCDVTIQFIVLGALSVLMSVFSFALGYYYCHSKECENELGWMYSKLKRMDEERYVQRPVRRYGDKSEREVCLKDEIPEAGELLKGNSDKGEQGEVSAGKADSGDGEDKASGPGPEETAVGEKAAEQADEKKE